VTYDWISFTTDYGTDDGFVAACVGVIARIAPPVRLIHITHTVAPQDIRRGATVLAQTAPFLPPSVHLAVVDPGVGTPRRPIVIVAAEGLLVGPDNGLLVPAADALGGILTAYELTETRYRLPTVSATFHGRDIFSPAAAHLAAGLSPHRLGPPLHPGTLTRLPVPKTIVEQEKLTTEVLTTDHFGNLQLAASQNDLSKLNYVRDIRVRIGDHEADVLVGRTFGDAGRGYLVLYTDSAGYLAVALNGGSAQSVFRCAAGDAVILTPTR
jgi:S-adenosylmethionine hydrolase